VADPQGSPLRLATLYCLVNFSSTAVGENRLILSVLVSQYQPLNPKVAFVCGLVVVVKKKFSCCSACHICGFSFEKSNLFNVECQFRVIRSSSVLLTCMHSPVRPWRVHAVCASVPACLHSTAPATVKIRRGVGRLPSQRLVLVVSFLSVPIPSVR